MIPPANYRLSKHKRFYCSLKCMYIAKRKRNVACAIAEANGYPRYGNERIRAMLKISPELKCSNCGCPEIRILEINHKNGGGGKENTRREKSAAYARLGRFYDDITTGRRQTDDLNLLCRVCNAVHYAELKGIKGFAVTYNKAFS